MIDRTKCNHSGFTLAPRRTFSVHPKTAEVGLVFIKLYQPEPVC